MKQLRIDSALDPSQKAKEIQMKLLSQYNKYDVIL